MSAEPTIAEITDELDSLVEAFGQGCVDDLGGIIPAIRHLVDYKAGEDEAQARHEARLETRIRELQSALAHEVPPAHGGTPKRGTTPPLDTCEDGARACAWEGVVHLFIDGELEGAEGEGVRAHLIGCATCARDLGDWMQLGALAKSASPEPARGGS